MTGLGARLQIAARALVGVFSDDAASAAYGMLAGIAGAGRGEPPPRGTAEYLKAYSTMPWLRAVTSKVSRSVAATTWSLQTVKRSGRPVRMRAIQRADAGTRRKLLAEVRQAGELVQVEEHPFLDLLDSTNSYLTGLSTRQLTQTYLDLIGEAFWIKERNGAGAPTAVWPIPPSWVQATPTPDRRSFVVGFRGWQGDIPDTEVLWFADPDPVNPYGRGTGTARALADELETDEYAAKHTKAWFYNRARPDLIIGLSGAKQEEVKRVEQAWMQRHQGFWRAFKPAFFGTKDIAVHQISQTFENMQLVELRQFERDTIVQVFGVPPETLGILNSSNRATIEAADYLFARWVLVPRLEFLRAVLQERLIPEYDDRLILDYESPVAEDKEHQLKVAEAAPWARTVDEWREMQGLPPLDDDRGRVHMMPFNLTPAEALTEAPAPARRESNRDVTKGRDQRRKQDADDLPISRIASRLEPAMRKRFLAAVERTQGAVDMAALERALESGAVDAAEAVLQLEQFPEQLGETAKLVRAGMQAGGELAAADLSAQLGASISFNLTNPQAVAWAREHAAALVTQVSDETRTAIRGVIERAVAGEMTSPQAARHIRDIVGLTERQAAAVDSFRAALLADGVDGDNLERRVSRYAAAQLRRRATTIARTEILTSANTGQQLLWEQTERDGLLDAHKTRKRWIVTHDDRLDPHCERLDGQEVGLKDHFPGGVSVPPLHPMCRCAVRLVFKD